MCLYALCVIDRVELCALLLNLMRLSGLLCLNMCVYVCSGCFAR